MKNYFPKITDHGDCVYIDYVQQDMEQERAEIMLEVQNSLESINIAIMELNATILKGLK